VNHVLADGRGIVDAIGPEARDLREYFDTFVHQVRPVAGVGRVVRDRVGDSAVAMDLFERDLPLVMALHAVEGHHRVERPGEALLTRVVASLIELTVAIFQQRQHHVGPRDREVEGHENSLGVPIGGATVLFAGETLRPDVESLVLAVVGRQQLEHVETYPLLRGCVAVDLDIGLSPPVCPGGLLLGPVLRVIVGLRAGDVGVDIKVRARGRRVQRVLQFGPGDIIERKVGDDGAAVEVIQHRRRCRPGQRQAGRDRRRVRLLDQELLGSARLGVQPSHGALHRRSHGELRRPKGIGIGAHAQRCGFVGASHLVPELLTVVGVKVVDTTIDGGSQSQDALAPLDLD